MFYCYPHSILEDFEGKLPAQSQVARAKAAVHPDGKETSKGTLVGLSFSHGTDLFAVTSTVKKVSISTVVSKMERENKETATYFFLIIKQGVCELQAAIALG